MCNLLTNLMIMITGKDGKEMMAMLWAQQIMLGKKTYEQVPRLLKEKVKEILADSGMEELIEE
ncbi:hypothetical protein MUY40_28735 [Blautia sp. NSJ-159]|uniref:CD1375 family protein n=1 Tax=unclassified Blautia TaxID=2648079 RepID=UPI001FD4E15B|nr:MULTISPECIES: CD1375 family protein [unclassified Blautia]MCJ7846417.1 hypothetical protein [Blautia sp. NSJ-175]MCJ8020924.1 hypothetical protein [Blautia sp. NSJ-159]MCJ8043831.1 hypothetical protein [Blautia sp. NSJ-165]DAG74761.1 MAG TPA: hypothetical protein [Caudoviricetes sp.]